MRSAHSVWSAAIVAIVILSACKDRQYDLGPEYETYELGATGLVTHVTGEGSGAEVGDPIVATVSYIPALVARVVAGPWYEMERSDGNRIKMTIGGREVSIPLMQIGPSDNSRQMDRIAVNGAGEGLKVFDVRDTQPPFELLTGTALPFNGSPGSVDSGHGTLISRGAPGVDYWRLDFEFHGP